jgi:hypothetical protein
MNGNSPILLSKNTGLSLNNKNILDQKANQIRESLINAGVVNGVAAKKTSSLSGAVFNMMPTAENTGKSLGYIVSQTFGAQVCNWMVQMFAYNILGMTPQSQSWSGLFKSMFTVPAVETMKMAVTPYAMPMVQIASVYLGGLSLPVAIAIMRSVGNFVKSGNTIPNVSEILEKAQEGKIPTVNGRQLTKKDIEDIQTAVTSLMMITKILMTPCNEFRKMFFIERSDGKTCFLDGVVVPTYKQTDTGVQKSDEMAAIEELEGLNILNNETNINYLIKMLSQHMPKPSENPLDKFVIKCSDDVYCNYAGEIVTQNEVNAMSEEVRAKMSKELQAQEKLMNEFIGNDLGFLQEP